MDLFNGYLHFGFKTYQPNTQDNHWIIIFSTSFLLTSIYNNFFTQKIR